MIPRGLTHSLLLLLLCSILVSCAPVRMMKKLNSGAPQPLDTTTVTILVNDVSQKRAHALFVNATVDSTSTTLRLIVDTGAMTMIDPQVADESGFPSQGSIPTYDKKIRAELVRIPRFAIDRAVVNDLTVVKIDFVKSLGFDKVDGILGSDFLRFFFVQFDYPGNQICIRQGGSSMTQAGDWIPIRTPAPLFAPMIECRINDDLPLAGMIDTGSPYPLVLPLKYLDKVAVVNRRESIGAIAIWPMSKQEINYLDKIASFVVGHDTLRDLPVLFADVNHVLIGKDILQSYRITIDYPRKAALLERIVPHNDYNRFVTTGLSLKKSEGHVLIRGVWKNSSADRAGLKPGDEVVEISGQQCSTFNHLAAINELLNREDGKEITLVVRKGDALYPCTVTNESLFP